MRALVLFLTAFTLAGGAFAQSCPFKPDGDQMYILGPKCDNSAPCTPGQALPFRIEKATACYPWYIPCPGYTIQACDSVAWDFGDGTKVTVTGDPNVTHTYKAPGLYSIETIVSNANGSGYVHTALIVAVTPVAHIAFADAQYDVAETAGSVTAKLKRTGDTTRRITIDYRTGYAVGTVYLNVGIVEGKVTFEPGETTKTISIPIVDDKIYNGDSYHYVWIECYTGDALLSEVFMGSTTIHVIEDDRPATATARSVRVPEGDSGTTLLKIPITLSEPMPDAVHFWWTLWERSAKRGSDWLAPEGFVMSGETVVPAGATSGEFAVQILGDTLAEPDEDFTLEFVRSGGPALVIDGSPVTITIVNDDLSFASESEIVASGQRPRLTLVTGPGTGTARLESSDPAVVEVPASVSVGAANATSFDAIAGRAGTATVRAKIDGTAKTARMNVTVYEPSPSIFSITPASGPATGGTRITILGANFNSGCTVKLGEQSATLVAVDPSSIVAITPPHESGFADVSVQCGDQTAFSARGFQFISTPKRRAARK